MGGKGFKNSFMAFLHMRKARREGKMRANDSHRDWRLAYYVKNELERAYGLLYVARTSSYQRIEEMA